jgi:hypothetical protein
MATDTAVAPMRPPPSLAAYLQNMGNEVREKEFSQPPLIPASPSTLPNSTLLATAQREVQKFKAIQERKAQLTQELQNLDMQLTKTQGALEVFQAMGIIRQG